MRPPKKNWLIRQLTGGPLIGLWVGLSACAHGLSGGNPPKHGPPGELGESGTVGETGLELPLACSETPIHGLLTLGLPDGGSYLARCDQERAGGGWTLVASNAWSGTWNANHQFDTAPFGSPELGDHKSPAWSTLPFQDLMFENGTMYAVYTGVGDQTGSVLDLLITTPLPNCGVGTDHEYPMAEGDLDAPNLCTTNLYIHPRDSEGGAIPCGDAEGAIGFAWSAQHKDGGCPLDDPMGATFHSDPWDENPWGSGATGIPDPELRLWAR